MSAQWIKPLKTRCFSGPSADGQPLLLIGRSSDSTDNDQRAQNKIKEDAHFCECAKFEAMLRDNEYRYAHNLCIRNTQNALVRGQLKRRVESELHLHELSVESRRDRLRQLLSVESDTYREEAAAKEPTTFDRLAQNRQKLAEIKEQKEKARLELVQEKYLQQAWNKHDDLRSFMSKRLELETEADRKEQIKEKQEKIAERKAMDAVFHQQLLEDVAQKARREEHDTITRHRANQKQVEVLLEQITQAHSKDDRQKREALEREVLLEQIALRKQEEENERKVDHEKKKFVHAMYDESIRLAKEKSDRIKMEENLFDLNRLEIILKSTNEEEMMKRQRKRELNEEIDKYCDDLKATRREEMQRKIELEQIIEQEMYKATEKETQMRKVREAASKRLLCDVLAVQKIQREEKSDTKGLTSEQRAELRQKIIQDSEALRKMQMHDRQQTHEKKLLYGNDLVGQMNYDRCRRLNADAEELRRLESEQAAERELAEQMEYLIQNPVSKMHPMRRKYNEMIKAMPTSFCEPT